MSVFQFPTIFGWRVHPMAAMYPMLDEEALRSLAADIAANGLVNPIIIGNATDADGVEHTDLVIDGRNRLAACELAGVVPRFERLPDGADPLAYILSVNVERRQLTKGQQAMAHAMAHPDPAKLKRGSSAPKQQNFSAARLSQARTVRSEAADLVMDVMLGRLPLDDAYQQTLTRRRHRAFCNSLMEDLHARHPDLAVKVTEGHLTLEQAHIEATTRDRQKEEAIKAGRRAATRLLEVYSDVETVCNASQLGEPGLVSDEVAARLQDAMTLLNQFRQDGVNGQTNGKRRSRAAGLDAGV